MNDRSADDVEQRLPTMHGMIRQANLDPFMRPLRWHLGPGWEGWTEVWGLPAISMDTPRSDPFAAVMEYQVGGKGFWPVPDEAAEP